jgi:hypothetical protein
MKRALALAFFLIVFSGCAFAEDKLKPYVDYLAETAHTVSGSLLSAFYSLFPSLEESVAAFINSVDATMPFLKDYHWLVYLAIFFVVMAVIAKLWKMSENYMINSIVGVILLLICIHLLGVELKITLLSLVITAIFGVPGVLFILGAHYAGIII